MSKVLRTELLTFNDKLYKVHRKIPKGVIKDKHILDVRDAWHCDTVLKTRNQEQEVYIFLIECPDAEIIEEIPYPNHHPHPTPVPPG